MDDEREEGADRISMKMIGEELLAFFSFERGSLHTTYRLLVAPGSTIRDYIQGDKHARRRLTNPLRYLAMSTAFVTVAYVLFMPRELFTEDVKNGMDAGEGLVADAGLVASESGPANYQANPISDVASTEMDSKTEQVRQLLAEIEAEATSIDLRLNAREAAADLDATVPSRVADITMAWMNVFLLAALPVNALLTWLAFRKSRFNLAENLAVNAFILGFQNVLAVAMLIPTVLGPAAVFSVVYMLISAIYQFIAWKRVFELTGILRTLLCLFVVMLSVVAFLAVQGIATVTLFLITTRGV